MGIGVSSTFFLYFYFGIAEKRHLYFDRNKIKDKRALVCVHYQRGLKASSLAIGQEIRERNGNNFSNKNYFYFFKVNVIFI